MLTLPKKIYLRGMKRLWKVSYIQSAGKLIIIEHPYRELALYGKKYSKSAALSLIARWVRLKAQDFLIALVKQQNRRVKATYKKIIIRSHDSQWGSYLPSKNISLDYKLIFLPPRLIKNVVLHELCHTKYWTHATKFWRELAKFDKKYKKHDNELNQAEEYIPPWVIF